MKYNLARMLKEIKDDEKKPKADAARKLTQDEIRKVRKAKEKSK